MIKIGFEQIDHTADVGIHSFGDDIEEAFEDAAKGMFSIMTDISGVENKVERDVNIEADNLESLLVNFLSELIYLHEIHEEFYAGFDVEIKENEIIILIAKIKGEKIDLEKHEIEGEVKAVSYHELTIDPEGEIRLILDI